MILEQSRSGVYNRSAQLAVAGFSRGSVALTQVRHNLQCPGAETQPEHSFASLSMKPPLSKWVHTANSQQLVKIVGVHSTADIPKCWRRTPSNTGHDADSQKVFQHGSHFYCHQDS